MGTMASQITSLAIVYSSVYSDVDQRKHQSSASLAFVRGIHRGPVNSPHRGAITRKTFPFDDVIMYWLILNGFLWRSLKTNFTRSDHDINSPKEFENPLVKLLLCFPAGNELKVICTFLLIAMAGLLSPWWFSCHVARCLNYYFTWNISLTYCLLAYMKWISLIKTDKERAYEFAMGVRHENSNIFIDVVTD